MSAMNLKDEISRLRGVFFEQLALIKGSTELQSLEVEWIGRKGHLTTHLKSLATASIEDRRVLGPLLNTVKKEIETALRDRAAILFNQQLDQKLEEDALDLSLPGTYYPVGHLHPLQQVIEEVLSVFRSLGFACVDGPEIESEFYNFEALNVPADHPARDMHDTFYLDRQQKQLSLPSLENTRGKDERVLLRTHTSPVQARIMEQYSPPIAVVSPGRVYRNEATDATHLAVFHQMEGLMVDEGLSLADLKGTLSRFAEKLFGASTRTRFNPSYFPFTEPSAEMHITCVACGGDGCRVCKSTGWVEILGAGMVNPRVFQAVGIDPERYTGFAFGMGIERIAMFKYGVQDLRQFYENDARFLQQF